MSEEPCIESIAVSAYEIPTEAPESDGTLAWDATTLVLVEAAADGVVGIGLSYADAAAARLAETRLVPLVRGAGALSPPRSWLAMWRGVRNLGHRGVAALAISAVDVALWDLKARLLGLPLAALLGRVRESIPAYASGGFTSLSLEALQRSLADWAAQGFGGVKMKVGRAPRSDAERVRAAREALGPEVALFVDANGAYERREALCMAERFAAHDVAWFEEPVSSDDVAGLRWLRDRAPARMSIAAGEYGWDPFHFRRLLGAGAVDVLQADATRCLGVTGFLRAAALCEAFHTPLSAHTAPSLHTHLCCAAPAARHVEYFQDHARIERWLFEGAPEPVAGRLAPRLDRPGLGLALREAELAPLRVHGERL